ncbi:proline-rich protein 7 [Lampris incognitus]|uniref:proline-rich protein 7 n=1 Tax=Lampris incognitus TaxID=2546036 RepID=UPI0024B51FB4|nr:proline-rich protein 7 [Lampris incognitus]
MVMSAGTYTFLACFAGFWLIWALVVMLCCICTFLQRRLKRQRERRLREQSLRALEMELLDCHSGGYPPLPPPPPPPLSPSTEPVQFCPPQTLAPPVPLQVPHRLPEGQLGHRWQVPPVPLGFSTPGRFLTGREYPDLFGKPPCYEEAVLMEDPPPPYNQVLADPRGGIYIKPTLHGIPPPPRQNHPDPPPAPVSETRKLPHLALYPERGYSSLIRLPSARRWDSLGHLLSTIDLNYNNVVPLELGSLQAAAAMATMPRREARTLPGGSGLRGAMHRVQELRGVRDLRGSQPSCGLPTVSPLLGRSTAV